MPQVSNQSSPVVISPIYISTQRDIDKFKSVVMMHVIIMEVFHYMLRAPQISALEIIKSLSVFSCDGSAVWFVWEIICQLCISDAEMSSNFSHKL